MHDIYRSIPPDYANVVYVKDPENEETADAHLDSIQAAMDRWRQSADVSDGKVGQLQSDPVWMLLYRPCSPAAKLQSSPRQF